MNKTHPLPLLLLIPGFVLLSCTLAHAQSSSYAQSSPRARFSRPMSSPSAAAVLQPAHLSDPCFVFRTTNLFDISSRAINLIDTCSVSCPDSPSDIPTVSHPMGLSDSTVPRPKNLSDSALLDLTEKQTFKYFWDFAHPVSGLSRERSNVAYNYGHEVCTIGGSGFGIMAIIVGTERKWITREQAVDRLLKEINFLAKADSYHGIFPHWLNGETGKTIPFSRKDDGADLVETSYLMEGLLCARQYFNGHDGKETELRNRINWLWQDAEFSWHTRGGLDLLYWHWSPNNGWSMNFELRGWNECLITYVLAASSPRYPINPEVYHHCWAESNHFYNGKSFYDITLPLGFDYGGPLFFAHYSFLGLDPRGLKDRYADYWEQNKNHTLINRGHCVRNPNHFKGYGPDCWGLTASDNYEGYNAHSPTNDLGVITPSAALSSFPYTPEYSMQALRYFYDRLGDKIWGEYGFTDAFSEEKNWYATEYLAIDQGPEIVMIENYRSGLLWKLFMSCPEIQAGLKKLGFTSPWIK